MKFQQLIIHRKIFTSKSSDAGAKKQEIPSELMFLYQKGASAKVKYQFLLFFQQSLQNNNQDKIYLHLPLNR